MDDIKANRRRDDSPKPFVYAPSQSWDGNDGRWSTFIVRVGSPEQNFRVVPSTSGHETFIPVPEGCIESDPTDCGSLRGAMPFNGKESSGFLTNASSTWKPVGLYTLNLGDRLGIQENGLFGLDNVGLMLQNSGGVELSDQVVAGIATKDFYLGLFGLGVKPSNFTDFENPQPAFMRTLKDQNKIPSLSFAYTAGAAYRIPQLPGSLTLGGYDASRFTPNDQTFSFSTDDSRVLSVGLQRITALNTLLGSRSLLTSSTLTLIDSTVPHIWLPRDACDKFAEAFGLTYDPNTDLYLVNDTMHDKLTELQPTITFNLGNDNNVAKAVTIQMPYGAFDLQASHPYYENATNYFPIRRAANDTQYTLGRTFLQEAYVIADYERSNFSVYQSKFESKTPEQQIIAISTPSKAGNPNDNNNTEGVASQPDDSGLSTGAKAGIGAGIGVLVLALLALAFLWYRRRKSTQKSAKHEPPPQEVQGDIPGAELPVPREKYEMDQGDLPGSRGGAELDSKPSRLLLSDDASKYPFRNQAELPAGPLRYEMDADHGKGGKAATRGDVIHEMDGSNFVVQESRDFKQI
ncbi:unnamed protein product [Periconia digitata]|uniref:Peptidase A1 domain-containing protein n=1 Tax=Periconia digitata TaxID=1303443 RepID=A0A9W4UCD4_9PLEO|nr:unnamed protein product [Periconia digitata]